MRDMILEYKTLPKSPRAIFLEHWSLLLIILHHWSVCIETENIASLHFRKCLSIYTFRRTHCCLSDWPPATFISHPPWLPVCCLPVINGRQFQGSLPWWSAEAMWWQSVTDCRMMNWRDRRGNQHARVLSSWSFNPCSRFSHIGNHTFTVRAPALWRDSSVEIRAANTVSSLKK